MEEKLIDYEGFDAYAKGVREKYAEKKDIITPNERKYLQLVNDGFELIRYWDVENLLELYAVAICETITENITSEFPPAFDSLVDLCDDNSGDIEKIKKDKRYTEAGFLGVLQKTIINVPQLVVKSCDGKDLTLKEIASLWKDKENLSLIWMYKDMITLLKSNYTERSAFFMTAKKFIKKFVKQEKGKGLSTNDYTDEDKKKVGQIPDNPKYTDTIPDLTPYAKTESIPTKLSQLENDKTYKTETEIQSMIEKASALKKEVVTSLPTTGKDDVIYLVKDEKGKENNNYLEYLWLNGKYELIGSTQVDLSGYVRQDGNKVLSDCNFSFNEREKLRLLPSVEEFAEEWQKKANRTELKTKLSEMTDDSTHRLVTDQERETWNNKLNKDDIQEFTQQELEEAFK